jgi:RNA polymerase sigma factor (sigma-70 family)
MQSVSTPLAGAFAPRPLLLRRESDARLVRLAVAGSEAAIAEIFERYHQALHRYCYSIVGNAHDAADALQNTMVKALRSLPGETREIALRPWLYRVAHNESISLLRARCTDAELDAAAAVGDPAAAGLIDSRQELRDLTADLGELTERQRAALLMRELGDLEFAEVATALGTSAAAVKQSVYEARCALQAMQQGRAMSCDEIRRALSDGDRRVLRGARMRAHLRACAGCRDFEVALHARPAQLNAMIPPLPLAAAAAMLHGGLGIGGGSAGGGLAAGVAGGAKATTGLTLGAKAAAVVAVTATLGGGAAYVVPAVRDPGATTGRSGATVAAPAAVTTRPAAATGTAGTVSPAGAIRRSARAAAKHPAAASSGAATHAAAPASPAAATGRPAGSGRPTTTPGSRPSASGHGKSAAAAGRKRAATAKAKAKAKAKRKPATLPARRPAVTPSEPAASPPAAAASPQSPASPAGANGTPPSGVATPAATPGPGAGGRP